VSRVYVSTACLAGGSDVFRVLDAYAAAGLRTVELGATLGYLDGMEPHLFKRYGFDFIVHSYFPPPRERIVVNLASQDAAVLDRSRRQIKGSIDFCHALGVDCFSFHAGFRVEPDENFTFKEDGSAVAYDVAFETLVESVKEINAYALSKGVRIAVENHGMPEKELTHGKNLTYMLCEAWEFERLWEAVPSNNIGMLLDLGHLKVASQSLGFDKEDFVDRVKERVLSVHVHDNNGRADEHREVTEKSWCLDVLRRGGFANARVVLESRGLSIDQILEQVRLLEKALNHR
jgi:sugar phosphate isomerase/epimerase